MASHEELMRTMEMGDLVLRLHQAGIRVVDVPKGEKGLEFAEKYFKLQETSGNYNPQNNQNKR